MVNFSGGASNEIHQIFLVPKVDTVWFSGGAVNRNSCSYFGVLSRNNMNLI